MLIDTLFDGVEFSTEWNYDLFANLGQPAETEEP